MVLSALLQKPLDRGKGKKLVQDAPGRYQPRPCLLYFLSLCFCTFLLHKYNNTSESKGRKETKNMSFNSGLLYFYSFLNFNHEHLLNESKQSYFNFPKYESKKKVTASISRGSAETVL